MKDGSERKYFVNWYIIRGIANNLPTTIQHQLYYLITQREQEQIKDNVSVNYFHKFRISMHNSQLYIKHKQKHPEHIKIHKIKNIQITLGTQTIFNDDNNIDIYLRNQ